MNRVIGVSSTGRPGSPWRARIRANNHIKFLGNFDHWFDAVCARKAAENLYPDQRKGYVGKYELRPCPYCKNLIPNVSSKGKTLKKGHYDQRRTCGESACFRESLKETRANKITFEVKTEIDWFLYRMAA